MGVRFTPDGTPFDEAASAMQKCIRRGMVDDSCYWANQLFERYPHYVWRRLSVCAVEDIGMANTLVVQELLAARASFYAGGELKFAANDPVSFSRGRMLMLQAVRDLAASPKSRESDDMVHECLRGLRIGKYEPVSKEGQTFDEMFGNVVAALDGQDEVRAYIEGHMVANGYAGWLWQGLHEYAFAQVGVGHVVQVVGLARDMVEAFLIKQASYEPVFMSFVMQLLCRSPRDTVMLDVVQMVEQKREVPDFAVDMHTMRGRNLGRDIRTFDQEGSILHPLAYPSPYVFFDPVHGTASAKADGTLMPEAPLPNMKKQALERRGLPRQGGLF